MRFKRFCFFGLQSGDRFGRSRCASTRTIPTGWGIAMFLAWVLLPGLGYSGPAFAAEGEGPILGNPMEKHFESVEEHTTGSQQQVKRSRFSDAAAPGEARNGNVIRQASGSAATDGIWNQTVAKADHAPAADWAIGPTPAENGFGPASAFTQPGSDPRPNAHSNTGSPGFASPSENSYPNFFGAYPQGGMSPVDPMQGAVPPAGFGAYGFGYYDPNTGRLYPNSDAYGMGATGADGNGLDGGGGFYNNGYYNGYYGNGLYGRQADPFGMGGYGMDAYGGFQGGTLGNPAMQQYALYQAMLQQEAIRREVEAETAAREESEREDGKTPDSEWTMKKLMPVHVTSPLGHTLLACAKTLSPLNTPSGPHRGVGMPLEGRSWLDRPWYFGLSVGTIWGSELVSNMIKQEDGGAVALLLGYNFNEYWGLESRLQYASIDIRETSNGKAVFESWYRVLYPDTNYVPPLTTRSNELTTFDFSVHYYPLGNAKFRPYFKYGLGFTRSSFVDTFGQKRREDSVAMPFGVGVRYWWNERIAIQADLIDNVVFSTGIAKTQNNLALSIGFTYSFGHSKARRPTAYWPYTPSGGSKHP